MANSTDDQRDDDLLRLVAEAQVTIQKAPTAAASDVLARMRQFIQLHAQLAIKPTGAALLYEDRQKSGASFREIDQALVVGRLSKTEQHPDACDLALEDAQMSRRHFRIHFESGFYILRDLDSRNGTYVNDEPDRIKHIVLKAGDVITAGASTFVFTGAPITAEEEAFRP